MTKKKTPDCFVIMPISDPDDYDNGHFTRVYEDIMQPAINNAGFQPRRADEVKETNFIHLDILKSLIDAPMAICDLSSRNPNVLFELGIRQAFDKPVVLIQEKGTPKIFDIGPLRYLEYSKDMKYHDVLKTQEELKQAIAATKSAEGESGNINSIVRLMALSSPAAIPKLDDGNKETLAIDVFQTQLTDMRKMLEIAMMRGHNSNNQTDITSFEYSTIASKLEDIKNAKMPLEIRERQLRKLLMEADDISNFCESEKERRMFHYLIEKIHRATTEKRVFKNQSR